MIRRIIKRSNSVLVKNFVRSLAQPKVTSIESYRQAAQELSKR
jgi:hypothetical protein